MERWDKEASERIKNKNAKDRKKFQPDTLSAFTYQQQRISYIRTLE